MSRLSSFLIILILTGVISAQPKIKRQPVMIDRIVLPADSFSTVYFIYQISFNELVFKKVGNLYEASVNLTFEISDSDKVIDRQADIKKVSVEVFEDTKDKNRFLRGFTSVKLPNVKLTVQPIIRALDKFKPIALRSFEMNLELDSTKNILEPIAVNEDASGSGFEVLNFGSALPFAKKSIPIIIPIKGKEVESIEVIVNQNKKEILRSKFSPGFRSNIYLREEDEIRILADSSGEYTIFVLNNLTDKLEEGICEISVKYNKIKRQFVKEVFWLNKPFSLLDPEGAIELLAYMVPQEKVEELLDSDEEAYYQKLIQFWRKYDRTPNTTFNEVMNEFYRRADYSRENFNTTNHFDGAKTDRGQIYIKYGAPIDIERDYSSMNNTIEIWHYGTRDFIFVDRTGLGNYQLIKP